jgi:hypothetical protein
MIVSNSFMDGMTAGEFAPFVDDAELDTISRFARAFPFAVHAHALELLLQAGIRHADYATCLRDEETTLRSVRESLGNGSSALTSDSYFTRFLEAWSEEGSSIRRLLPLFWLEYDRPGGEFARTPGLFLALAEDLRQKESAAALDRTLDLLYDPAEVDRKRRTIAQIVTALPAASRVRHLGAVPSRDPHFMRLVIEGLDREALPPFLSAIGWKGDFAYLARLLALLRDRADVFPALVDLDLLDTLQPTLGLEFLLVGSDCPDDDGLRLLSLLLENEWCSRDKFDAISGWLNWTTRESPEMEPLAFWEKLYHIKLTLKESPSGQEGPPHVECKAYWGVWGGPKPDTLRELHTAVQRFRR